MNVSIVTEALGGQLSCRSSIAELRKKLSAVNEAGPRCCSGAAARAQQLQKFKAFSGQSSQKQQQQLSG